MKRIAGDIVFFFSSFPMEGFASIHALLITVRKGPPFRGKLEIAYRSVNALRNKHLLDATSTVHFRVLLSEKVEGNLRRKLTGSSTAPHLHFFVGCTRRQLTVRRSDLNVGGGSTSLPSKRCRFLLVARPISFPRLKNETQTKSRSRWWAWAFGRERERADADNCGFMNEKEKMDAFLSSLHAPEEQK